MRRWCATAAEAVWPFVWWTLMAVAAACAAELWREASNLVP